MEDFFAKMGVKIPHIITGLIAGAIGTLFNARPRTQWEKIRSYCIIASGAIVTAFVTPLIVAWKPFFADVEYSVAFIVGIFGMGILEGIYKIVQRFNTSPLELLETLKKIWKNDRE